MAQQSQGRSRQHNGLPISLGWETVSLQVPAGTERWPSLGRQYISFALNHPLEYRLMFGTPWPQSAEHPDLVRDATHAFDILRKALARIHQVELPHSGVDQDALFIWSTMHGLAGVLASNCMQHLQLSPSTLKQTPDHVIQMIGKAMEERATTSIEPR